MSEGLPPPLLGPASGDGDGSRPAHSPRRQASQARQAREGLSRRTMLMGGATAVAAAGGTGIALLTAGSANGEGIASVASVASTTGTKAATSAATSAKAATGTATAASGATTKSAAAATATKAFDFEKDVDPALLLGRATFGRNKASDALIAKLGPKAWLEQQLRPASIPDPAGEAVDAQWPRVFWSVKKSHANLVIGDWSIGTETAVHHLGHTLFSSRQLYMVMVDFWSNHLNVVCPNGDLWATRHSYQIDVIRKHAMGSFEDLFMASALHPAMQRILNNSDSTGDNPNENYARESLELHTVGINGGYTEKDVHQAALLLTGYYLDGNNELAYEPARHYKGPVKIMGFKDANADPAKGQAVQRRYLRYLVHHPKTATHIATKLATHFVSDTPPKSLIKKLAAAYTKHDTQIVPILRTLFTSPEFAASSGQKVRRPMEQLIASFRAMEVRNEVKGDGLFDLYWLSMGNIGQQPLAWSLPNGYPDTAEAWQSPGYALAVLNLNTSLVYGWWPNRLKLTQPAKLLANPPGTRAATITAVAKKVFGRGPTKQERAAAQKFLAASELPGSFSPGSWEQIHTVSLTAILFLASPAHMSV